MWAVFEFDVEAQFKVTLCRQGAYSTNKPLPPASTTPLYCTR